MVLVLHHERRICCKQCKADYFATMIAIIAWVLRTPKLRGGKAYKKVAMVDMGEWTNYNQLHGFDESHIYGHILFYRPELNVLFFTCFFHAADVIYKRKDTGHKKHGAG